jgi:hypothetical protein
MKTSIGVMLVALAIGGGLAFSQGADPKKDDPKDDSARKIAALENDLVTTRAKAEAVAVELADTKAAVTRIVAYLDAQAHSAQQMAETLDNSEQAGFTAGINPNSRTMLLAGWREQLNVAQANVPTGPTPTAKPDDGKGDKNKPK